MNTPSVDDLGAAIRRLRTERELTLETLARGSGIHWTYLSGIERGRRNPTWKVLTGLARTLGVSVSDLAREAEAITGRDAATASRSSAND